MKNIQVQKSSKNYDVIIVGSGAGGGMAGYILAKAGVNVLMLEAGPFFDPAKNSLQLQWPWQSPRRGASTTRAFGDFDAAFGGWKIDGEPYTQKDGTEFKWFRSHMLGGRTNHWGWVSLRYGPYDFKGRDHWGPPSANWPISYNEIKPFYDRIDRLIGIYGTNEGLVNFPDGIFLPPPKLSLGELFLKKGAERAGVKVVPGRGSVLTKALSNNNKRGACFFCGQCDRSCKVYADFSSSSVLVIPAIRTGNLKVIPNAMVRTVVTGKDGLAKGVSYISKEDNKEYKVRGKTVVLAASTCSTARILLNSKTARHPEGLANSSGLVGKYLHDTTMSSMGGFVPQLLNRKRYNEDGVGSVQLLSPWWLNNKNLDFPRGYKIEYYARMGMPSYGFGSGVPSMNGMIPGPDGKKKAAGGYGKSLKKDYRRFYGTGIGMGGEGVCIARKSNYCEIDQNVVDKFGIPVLRFQYKWSDAEIKQARHMQQTFASIMDAIGAIVTYKAKGKEDNYGLGNPGEDIHEVGTTRMGNNPETSVLNSWCQAHDCKNLFVADGSPFVQAPEKNPTWTIIALAMRTAEYIIDQKKKKNIS